MIIERNSILETNKETIIIKLEMLLKLYTEHKLSTLLDTNPLTEKRYNPPNLKN
jgi:hypothetical protein